MGRDYQAALETGFNEESESHKTTPTSSDGIAFESDEVNGVVTPVNKVAFGKEAEIIRASRFDPLPTTDKCLLVEIQEVVHQLKIMNMHLSQLTEMDI